MGPTPEGAGSGGVGPRGMASCPESLALGLQSIQIDVISEFPFLSVRDGSLLKEGCYPFLVPCFAELMRHFS